MAGGAALGHPTPRVSIVIPAYNAERFLAATVRSVQRQRFTGWELIVFDDGSTDGTLDVARGFADGDARIHVVEGANGGVAAARNRGFAATDPRSELVIFLDNDDLWEPEMLEVLVGVLDEHPGYAAAHCVARCIDGDGERLHGDDLEMNMRRRRGFRGEILVDVPADEATTFADLVHQNWILTPGTLLIRRAVAELTGGFDPSTVPADDWDMGIRVSRHGDIGFVDRPLLLWRRHDEVQSASSPHWRRAYFRVRAKSLLDLSNGVEHTHAARLAFLDTCRSTRREARDQIVQRRFGPAVRAILLTLQRYLLYAGAELRRRRGPGASHRAPDSSGPPTSRPAASGLGDRRVEEVTSR
jgi:alpha-1,3-rhamnosyltransferase